MAQILLKQLQDSFNKAWNLIDEKLRPNPKYTGNLIEQEMLHKRNKAVFIINFCSQFMFFYDVIINNGSLAKAFVALMTIYTLFTVLFISCRYHPQIFNCFYNLLCLSFGPSMMRGGAESITYGFIVAGFSAFRVQVVTGSYAHYILQTIGQIILVNVVYKKPLKEVLQQYSPDETVRYFTHAACFNLFYQTLVVIFMHRILAQTQEKAFVLDQKRNEAESQKTFLLSFSHELRNLINSLTGNVKLANLESIKGRAKDFLLNAEVCGELLLHMINNILDTGKAAIGELEIHPVPTKTYEAFERIWGICAELIRRKDLRGSMKIPKSLPRVMMLDHHRLTQIFLNLVGNAIKFTEKGCIEIKVEWFPNRNIVNEKCFQPYPFNTSDEQDEGLFEKQQSFTSLDEDYAIIGTAGKGIDSHQLLRAPASRKGILKMIVTDTGCGMSKEQTDKLFQKFTQVTTDTTKKKLGAGLGLFITKQLCQRMNGEIRVFSQRDQGSSFVFCIPIDIVFESNQHANFQASIKPLLQAKNLQVMIVDDIPSNHVILKTFFENLCIQVSNIALNGLEAYKKYSDYITLRKCPQIISMDLDMPIMDGKEAAQKIREIEKDNGLKPVFLVIISGNCLESEIVECLDKQGRIKADAFLKKPLRIEDLTRVITSHFLNE